MYVDAPDVPGILTALAKLPDRTPEQLRAYEVHRSAHLSAERLAHHIDEDRERFDEAVEWVLQALTPLNLSKKVREQISDELNIDWPKAS